MPYRLAALAAIMLVLPAAQSTASNAPPVLARDLMLDAASPALTFSWRAPPEIALHPAPFVRLRTEATRLLAAQRAQAVRDHADGSVPRPYDARLVWSVDRDGPRRLVLARESYSYTGGAHGNTELQTLIWDKPTGRALAFDAIFTDWSAARRILEPAICAELNSERRARQSPATACPSLSDAALGIFGGRAASSIRVRYAPYVAGSCAGGTYVLAVAWPDAARALVRAAYRADLFPN